MAVFYYYGRKKQIAKYYPLPNYQTIIEPFAGSAAYSFHGSNWQRDILLIEKDPRVASVWEWLINEATPESFLNMPDLKVGEKSSEFLHIIHAATKMAFQYKTIKVTPLLARNWEISRRLMYVNLFKIKHWHIINGDYRDCPDIEATWFIDPPYKGDAGRGYKFGSQLIDYTELAQWALKRKGEIIFCEGGQGDYLPFRPLVALKGVSGKTSSEVLFYQSPFAGAQSSMFRFRMS